MRKLVSLPFPWKADINNEKEKKKICVCVSVFMNV